MVECTGLENRNVRKGIVGSNPTLSASQVHNPLKALAFAASFKLYPLWCAKIRVTYN